MRRNPSIPMIQLEEVSYLYSAGTVFETAAIQDINLSIEQGEFVGIIGHTGSGKSTLVQHLNGLLRPSSGTVYINGEDIWKDPKDIRRFRFKVGLVFQYPEHQLFEETVYKDIAFGPTNMGLPADEIHSRVLGAAHMVGLDQSLLEKSPFEISGGQQRRVAIAGVIAMEPEVLVLDEPTAGLDPQGRNQVLQMVQEYHRKTDSTVLLVSHSMEDIASYANKVLVMEHSEVYMYEDVKTVFSHAEDLERLDLSVPQITKICLQLHQMGYPIDPSLYTVEQAEQALLDLLRKGGNA